jgi:hypothetical protein
MFLKAICPIGLASALAVTLFGAAACSDSKSDNNHESGDAGEDSSAPGDTSDSAVTDSGKDSAVAKTDAGACGVCEKNKMFNVSMPACCIEKTGKCGLDTDSLKEADPSSALTGCLERDRAGKASEYCTSFFDQIDGKVNGYYDLASSSGTLQIPGCCTPAGECGLSFSDAKILLDNTGNPIDMNFHLGCIGYRELPSDRDGGNSLEMDKLPFCNPNTGDAPTEGTLTGVPQFVCGCGESVVYNHEVQALPCLSHLKKDVCGADKVDEATMKQIPVYVCGCGANKMWDGTGLPCLNNLESTTCGTEATNSTNLAKIPEYVCGCGESERGTGTCLAHVAKTTCGALAVTSSTIAGLPEYACGCGDGVVASGCIPNVPPAVCGAEAFTGTAVPGVPEYACGCGDGVIAAGCIPNVPVTVCGANEVTSGTVPGLPEYACGCGDGVLASGCIPNVPATVCGAVEFTGTAVPSVPEYACGCGDGVIRSGCIPNVPATVCGAQEVTSGPIGGLAKIACGCGDGVIGERCIPNVPATICGADNPTDAVLAATPDSLCGCGDNVLASGRPCLNNVALSVCGTEDVDSATIAYLPASLCGCGADVTYDPANAVHAVYPCLSKQPVTSCGGKPVEVTGGTASCITGVKAYAHGCGTDANAGVYPPTCVPHAGSTLWGCDQPADGLVVPFQPKYVCGCGVGVFSGQCIPNVGTNVCGNTDPTEAQLATIPEYVCGCVGDTYARTTCLRNIPVGTCGTLDTALSTHDLDGNPSTTNDIVSCLVNVPEYARGCGNDAGPSVDYPTCLRNAGDPADPATRLYGCVNIPSVTSAIVGIAEYLCGCGETATTDPNVLPCLAYVGVHADTTPICGAVPITTSQQVSPAIPNYVCGCGDGVTSAEACLDNVPTSVCGGMALCTPIGSQGDCDTGKTCRDLQGGTGAGANGFNGDGDGIGDTCVTNTP